MTRFRCAVLGATAFLVPLLAHAECFSMVDARNRVVYQSTTSPIDLSGSIGTAMARRFPGRSLIISATSGCAAIDEGMTQRTASAASILDARRTTDADYAGTSAAPAPSTSAPSVSADGTIDDGPPVGRVDRASSPSNFAAGAPASSQGTASSARAATAR